MKTFPHKNLDITLGDIQGLNNHDRDILIDYLEELSIGLQKLVLNYYE